MLNLNKVKKINKINKEIVNKRITPWDIIKGIVSLHKKRNDKNFNKELDILIDKVNDNERNLKYILNHCLLIHSVETRMELEKPIFVSNLLTNKEYVRFFVYYLINKCNNLPNYNIFYKLGLRDNIFNEDIIKEMNKNDVDYCSELNKTPYKLLKLL